jgi:hypothetical protein
MNSTATITNPTITNPTHPTPSHTASNQENAMTTVNPTLAANRTSFASSFPASLNRALRSDFISVATIRSTKIVGSLATLASGAAAFAVIAFAPDEGQFLVDGSIGNTALLTMLLSLVVGVLAFTTDAQHGSLVAQVTAQPSRSVLAVSRTITAGLLGASFAFFAAIAGTAGALAAGAQIESLSTVVSEAGWVVGTCALAGVLGLGVGMTVRHSALAITGVLAWWLVVEGILTTVLNENTSRYLPFAAGLNAVQPGFVDNAMGASASFALFGGYALAALAIGFALFNRRDIA